MGKTLNWKFFKYLDSYHDEAYNWATKEYNKIKDKKEMAEIDIDVISGTFVCIYSDFLNISMGYADGTTVYMLEDFYEKSDINKELDAVWNCRDIICASMTDSNMTTYNNLISSVSRVEEDEYGDVITIDPIDQESYSFQKHCNVLSFVEGGFHF